MTPMAGYLGDRLGRKQLYLIAVAGFVLTSMVCGLATSIEQMVLFRFLQGCFGAPLVPLAQATMLDTFPPSQTGGRDGDVRHGRDAGADPRPESRRVSHRVLQLALGVLHQRAARRDRAARHSGGHQGSADIAIATGRSTSAASRCSASRSVRCS